MSPTRRDFVRTTGVVGTGLALGANSACTGEQIGDSDKGESPTAPLRILILGGTGFIGPHMVSYAVERGHRVSIFTRGQREIDLPESVERLQGDRNDDHDALEGRVWDVVLDNNAQDYRWVQKSTELLAGVAQQYVFVSSISAYALQGFGWDRASEVMFEPLVDEDYHRIETPQGWKDGDDAPYGLMKTLSENIVHAAFPGRATVVRPGLIAGPGDMTDRFTYWPVRLDEGGRVLAPGNPDHANQVIDQRDLTEWIVRLAESRTVGDFNATGPAERMSMGSMLDKIGRATETPHELTWIPESFLEGRGVSPWQDLPAWIPGDPLMFVDVSDAVSSGLTFRPLVETAKETLEWDKARPAAERANRRFGMSRQRERELLDAWSALQG